MSLGYAWKQLNGALGDLAGPADITRELLADAAFNLVVLEPSDFPTWNLRIRFARIHEALTAGGSVDDTVRAMPPQHVQEIAADLWSLWQEVDRLSDEEED